MSRRPESGGRPQSGTDATQTSEFAGTDVAIGEVLAGRYRIERLVGMGAMGQVFEAHDEHLDTRVAAKLLRPDLSGDPKALERFRQELLVARKVSHPNVIRLHDMVRDGDHWLITMDYVEGETLEQRLSREGSLGVEEAVRLCRDIASGLEAAHREGVVHRDLKPGNILIDKSGRAYISDFGIARSVSQAGLTRQGALIGTPDYLSPEQAGGNPVDARSDLYALGIILCEMLTGRLPFDATTTQEAISQRLARSPAPLDARRDDVPSWLVRVCHRLLRRNPRRRYQCADEVLADLGSGGQQPRPKWLAAAGAAVVTAGFAAIAYFAWFGPKEVAPPVPAASAQIAVLPAVSAGDEQTAWATADYLADHLHGMSASDAIDTLRLRTVLARLDMAADRLPDHLSTVAAELGEPRLAVPRFVDRSALTIDLYEPTEGYDTPARSFPASGDTMLAVLTAAAHDLRVWLDGTSPDHPPVADSWEATRDFYTGLQFLDQGNPMTAVQPLTTATEADPSSCAAWWALSRAYESLGRWDEAQDAAFKAGSNATGDGRYARLARARQAIATGDYAQAQTILESLAASYPDDNRLKVLLAEFHGEGGDMESAISMLREVTTEDPEHVRAWFLLAKFSILSGDSRRALDDFLVKALVIQNRLENRQGQADVINAMGVAYERLGQSDQAAEHYQRAVEIRRAIGDRRGEASTLRNLAAIEAIRGNTEVAGEYLDRARTLLEALDDQEGLAALYNDMGFLAEEAGSYKAALDAYRNALRIRRQLPNERALAESLSNVGYAFYQLGQYDNAEAYWQQADTLFDKVGDAYNRIHMAQQLALLDWVQGRWDQATTRLEQTLHQTEAQQMQEERAVTLGLLAQVFLSQGRYSEALETADQARTLFQERSDQRGLVEMHLLTAGVFLALADAERARVAIEAIEGAAANQEQSAKLEDLRARLEVLSGRPAEGRKAVESASEHALASGSASTRVAVAVTSAEVGDALGEEPGWQNVIDDAEALGHVSLRLHAYRTAIEHSLDPKNPTTEGWLTTALKLTDAHKPTRHDPWLAAFGARLCPVAGRDCDDWARDLESSIQVALPAIPEAQRNGFRKRLSQLSAKAESK